MTEDEAPLEGDDPRARWAASHGAVCRWLFEVCGARASDLDDDALCVLLASLSGQFAFHASLLVDLLPARQGVDREALVAAAVDGDGVGAARDVLGQLGGLAAAPLAAVLARVVVPRLLAALDEELGATDRALDGPRARALTLCTRDLADARGELERCVERLVVADGALDPALDACAKSERRLVDGGVIVGVVAVGAGQGG